MQWLLMMRNFKYCEDLYIHRNNFLSLNILFNIIIESYIHTLDYLIYYKDLKKLQTVIALAEPP